MGSSENQGFLECNSQLSSHLRELNPISKEAVEVQWKCPVHKPTLIPISSSHPTLIPTATPIPNPSSRSRSR